MLKYACENFDYIDDAEKKYNFLLHQRISAVIAKEYFKISDENILSAIECHTTLKAEASDYDMLLFIADKLSWDQNGRPPFYDDVIKAFDVSIYHASFAYIEFILNDASLLYPHKWLMEARNFLFHKCKKEKQ